MQIERNNKLYRQVDGRCWGNQLVHRVSAATNTLAYMSVYWRLVHGSYLTSPFAFFSWIFLVPRYRRDDAVAEKATAALRRWRSCTHPMHPSSSLIHPFTHIYQLIFVFLFFFFLHFHCGNNILLYVGFLKRPSIVPAAFYIHLKVSSVFLLYDLYLSKFFCNHG